MGSLKRKMARNKAKKEKKEFEKVMKQQLMMFDKLGTECAACSEPYDKNSKEHAMTWKVVVREKEETVRLYCPPCWDKANKIIEEFNNDFRISSENGSDMSNEGQPK
jgi:hypothetical protein